MNPFAWAGALVLLLGGILGLIKPIREQLVEVVRSLYVRWRPWRIVLSQDWLTRDLRASLIRGDDGTEIPYVLRNRGPDRATNVTMTRHRKGTFMAINVEDVTSDGESKPFSFPNNGFKRLWLTVSWDPASSRTQLVHLPKFRMQSRAEATYIKAHNKRRLSEGK